MSRKRDLARGAANLVHGAIARSRLVSRTYLGGLGGAMRLSPDCLTKRRIVANTAAAMWPELEFGPHRVRVGSRTISVVSETNDYHFAALFSRALPYETEVFALLDRRLPVYDAVIEIGANIGLYTTFFAKVAKTADAEGRSLAVYAFEPSRKAFAKLQRHLSINGVSTTEVFNCAVADRTEFRPFYEPSGHITNGSLDQRFAALFSPTITRNEVLCVGPEIVEVLLARHQRALLKIDAEGSESAVLSGLEAAIRRTRPDIVVEVLQEYAQAVDALAFRRDYRCFNITPEGLVERDALIATQHRDYLLVHCERPSGVL